MHWNLQEWWKQMDERELQTKSFVHWISLTMFNKNNKQHFDVSWTDISCKREIMCIMLSHLSHDSHGPATAVCWTMLLWFVGVQEDHETLNIVKSDTWSELFLIYHDFIHVSTFLSELFNKYSMILHWFSGAISLTGLGGISDALVGRQQWDTPNVMHEIHVLLGQNIKQIENYIKQWHQKAVLAVISAINDVISAEKAAYGQCSYFYCMAHNIDPSTVTKDDSLPEISKATCSAEKSGDHY